MTDFGEACSDFIQGFSEYVEALTSSIEVPLIPRIGRLLNVTPHLLEARDLLSLGYVHTALFVLSRTIEDVFRTMTIAHNSLMGSPDLSKVRTFDDHIRHLSSVAYEALNAPILLVSMTKALDAIRQYRNMVVHGEELSEEFLSTILPGLAKLCIDVLNRLEKRLAELDSALAGASPEVTTS